MKNSNNFFEPDEFPSAAIKARGMTLESVHEIFGEGAVELLEMYISLETRNRPKALKFFSHIVKILKNK